MNEFIDPRFFTEVVRNAVSHGEQITVDGTGDSMRPFIMPETDRITLGPLPEKLRLGDICMYLRENGAVVIHRVYAVHKNSVDMLGDGQLWVERGVPKERLVALVTERIRNGESLSCTTPSVRAAGVVRAKRRMTAEIGREYLHEAYKILKK